MAFNERIVAYFGGDTSNFDAALRSMPSKVAAKAREIKASWTQAIVGSFSVGALFAGFEKVASFSDQIRKTSEAVGVSTDFLQEFSAAARENGSSTEAAQKGLEKLAANLGKAQEEGGDAAATFEKYGIAITNANGSNRTVEQVVRQIADRMKEMGGGAQSAAMAMDLLGKGAIDLIPTLQSGSEALDEFGNSLNKLSEEDIKSIDDAKDAIDSVGHSAMITGGRIVGQLLTGLDKLRKSAKEMSAMDLARTALTAVLNPYSAVDAVAGMGSDNSGKGPSLAAALAKRSRAEQAAMVKQMAKDYAEQKRQSERAAKAETELANVGESSQDKVNRLKQETSDLQAQINHDEFSGVELDKKRADLAEKMLELAKAEKDVQKQQAEMTEKRKQAEEKLAKAREGMEQAQRDRYGFTLEQLAGESVDFNPASGVRGRSHRRRAVAAFSRYLNNVTPEEAYARDLAQQIAGLEAGAGTAASFGHFIDAQSMRVRADDLRSMLPDFAKPSEQNPFLEQQKAMNEALKTISDLATKQGLQVVITNGAQ